MSEPQFVVAKRMRLRMVTRVVGDDLKIVVGVVSGIAPCLLADKRRTRALLAAPTAFSRSGEEMAQPDHDGRCADGAKGCEENGADAARGNHRRGLPAETSDSHGISGLRAEAFKQRKRFKTYKIGFVQIDSCELWDVDGEFFVSPA
ncbi:MAG: hypothetical protein E5W70_18190 [Mesorhizobium sp.]|uniref:hypothetical protein n=1 Tax=Mesorhizobium sp. TaxID=1871066 RepID=UPI0012157D05|nr:hypothetical protein [Mesorhizobium sp.]TIT21158.1 MAG: hypothetical protein E5W70_18190 [Mesorhizobium sp.]